MEENEAIAIHTGFPNPATDSSITALDLTKLLVKHPISTFLMRIRGRNWEEHGVFDGDIAVIDKSLQPYKSDTIVWWQGSDFMISKSGKAPSDCVIWGVVTCIIHQYRV